MSTEQIVLGSLTFLVGLLTTAGWRWVNGIDARLSGFEKDSAKCKTDCNDKIHALDLAVKSLASSDVVSALRVEMATLSANMANLLSKIEQLEKKLEA